VADLALLIAFALICLGGLGYLAKGMGMPVPLVKQGWTLKARFPHAEGVVAQDDVYVSGVQVGKVLSIQPDGTKGAIVTMRINNGVRLHQDVQAYATPKTAIGDTYIDLVRTPNSKAPMATSGYEIPPSRTGQSVQLDKILNEMRPPVRAAMSHSLQELGAAVSGQSSNIHTSIPQVNKVAANLQPIVQVTNARQHDVNQILIDLAVIMRSLAQEQQSLGTLVDSGDTAMGAIAKRDSDLGGTVAQANTLMKSLETILRGLTPADRTSLAESPPTLESGLKLLAQLNPVIDRLLPEILLAQVNYPNNQNSVTSKGSEAVAREWLSAFSQRDNTSNMLRITPIADLGTAVKLPISLPGGGSLPGAGSLPGGTASGGASSAPGGAGKAAPHASPQIPSKDASGGSIPPVAQMLMELP
jgi:phospholipid/cholesterol/gamma-HCH transport system substrate-binding protein